MVIPITATLTIPIMDLPTGDGTTVITIPGHPGDMADGTDTLPTTGALTGADTTTGIITGITMHCTEAAINMVK